MKNPLLLFASLFCVMYMAVTSCVPTRKLKRAQSKINQLKRDSSDTHTSLNACNASVKKLQDEKKNLTDEYTTSQKDLNNLSSSSQMTIADQAKRLKTLQDLIQSQKDALNKLKQSISEALVNFKPDELAVTIQDGKLYVSLEEKLLFKTGSADVGANGKHALRKLADVLNNTSTDINMVIEGHTDNVPIHNAKFTDNWSLSTERALSIVRILTKEDGFDSRRIIASGRGEFHPVKSNDTVEGRASNRRTEIILSPNLTELFQLLNQ